MAKSRSPRYPNIPISEAIQKVRAIYEQEQTDPASAEVMAEHMGYKGLNGASLKALSSLRKYNLLEGRGDDLRVSRDAQTLILDPADSPSYRESLRRCAYGPELFASLRNQFKGNPSERNVAVYLEKQGFKRSGAALAAKNFLETVALIGEDSSEGEEEAIRPDNDQTPSRPASSPVARLQRKPGMRQDVFTLEEGDVVFQWPEGLSKTSADDLKAWAELVLRKIERSVAEKKDEADEFTV